MNTYNWIKKIYRYTLVGTGNTIICFLIMALGAYSGLHYMVYTALGYGISIPISFFANLYYTFEVKGHLLWRGIAFFVMNIVNLLLVEVIEYYLVNTFHFDHIMTITISMAWYIIVGFLFNQFFIYRHWVSGA